MEKLPLITLGIPLYNARDLIAKSLLSALNQTYPNIEYILIDDKGNSMDIVYNIISNHPRKKFVRIIDNVENKGVANSRNLIIANASGQFLFTMDCDDIIVPNCLDVLYDQMKKNPVDFVAGSYKRRDLLGNIYSGCTLPDLLIKGNEFGILKYRYVDGNPLYTPSWNKLYDLNFLKLNNIKCYPGQFNEDLWFTFQVILKSQSCVLLSKTTLYYTFNPYSVTEKSKNLGYSESIASEFVDIERLKLNLIEEYNGKSFYKNLLYDVWKMSIYFSYQIQMSKRISKDKKYSLMQTLLTRSVAYSKNSHNKGLFKYNLLVSFYKLPLTLKIIIIKILVLFKVKNILKSFIHF